MSALGQKRTFAAQNGMSVLPPIADMCSALAHVRFGPEADSRRYFHDVCFTPNSRIYRRVKSGSKY
jgi:hypothetical protein